MLFTFLLFLFSLIPTTTYKIFLQKPNWNQIKTIIHNTDSNSIVRKNMNNWLYYSFEKWAINQAYEFKFYHKYKSRNIQLDDFILSSKLGLHKSIQKYNGTSSFTRYSKIYIQGELHDCLTLFHPLTNLPKSYRKKSKDNLNLREKQIYKKQLDTSWVPYEDFWRFDKMRKDLQEDQILVNFQEREKHAELWKNIMGKLDPITKKIFQYKYDYDFKIIKSNREIAEIIGFSEEYVRLRLNKINLHN